MLEYVPASILLRTLSEEIDLGLKCKFDQDSRWIRINRRKLDYVLERLIQDPGESGAEPAVSFKKYPLLRFISLLGTA